MEQKLIFSVSQLNELVKMTLEAQPLLEAVCVRGEISNFTNHYKTGHFYFSLKDEKAVVKAVMFASYASRCRFRPENGMTVLAKGRVSAFVRDGQYQIYVESMEPDGLGSLALAYEQRKEKLQKLGMFDPAHKRPLPPYPDTIGIITSPSGAAVRDIIQVAKRRFAGVRMILYPALVQGEGAAEQLCRGIRYFNRTNCCDVILIGRGGGSLEDLWAFNDESLAHEIYASKLPVISAVGHETDFTICDFVADVRAPTPSAAAELAVPDAAGLRLLLQKQSLRMQGTAQSRLKALRQHLGELSKKRCLSSPLHYTAQRRMAIDRSTDHLCAAIQKILFARRTPLTQSTLRLQQNEAVLLAKKRHATAALGAKLDAMSPLSVLRRGYSITKAEDGTVLRDASMTSPGSALTITLQSGSVHATVTKTDLPKKEN